jgi:hypothetical protein
MSNDDLKLLCLSLMKADTEAEVFQLLTEAGLWESDAAWRYYGDYENNYNTIGNQQSRPDAALVEKLVNSVDARLMNECFVQGIDPEDPSAPQSIVEAVAVFFEPGVNPKSLVAGRIKNWPNSRRTEVARGITFAATGATAQDGNPCFTISDCGEAQTPERMPETFLSLTKSNKLRIPFVQGKFNMGGTGVLKFCGRHNLQLIVSRRNPAALSGNSSHPSDMDWGFTVVRREDPQGNRRSSVYTYLAPVGCASAPNRGGVFRFSAATMPIFPDGQQPYARESASGTLVKLYEYAATGLKGNILMRDGMLRRMDLLLPDVALPIRFHECREYRGHAGSFETTLTGLSVRLDDDKGENLEPKFPSSCQMSVAGERMTATIYAFKKGKAETYRKNEGIIFTVNGQTHGHLTQGFFAQKSVGLSYLADSILVVVDCTALSGRAREDLFMNSRDRLSAAPLRHVIEEELEVLLKNHDGLRELKNRRRDEELQERLKDSKPLEEVLEALLRHSPTLSQLFLLGNRATNPFKPKSVKSEEKAFEGKRFPTYFRFKGKEYGAQLSRDCHINTRCRVPFETDAVNDYFSRQVDPGRFVLSRIDAGGQLSTVEDYSLNLQNGIAVLNVKLPNVCRVGDAVQFIAVVADSSQIEPFRNEFTVHVMSPSEPSGGKGKRRKPPSEQEGDEREIPTGIELPTWVLVKEEDWGKHDPPFDQHTALRIRHAGNSGESGGTGDEKDIYDFYINADNVHLKRYLKQELRSDQDEKVAQTRFELGLMLTGLALIHQAAQRNQSNEVEEQNPPEANLELQVGVVTRAIAPFLLPMIDALGALDTEDVQAAVASSEST